MTRVYTYLDEGDYVKLSEDDIEKTIEELSARINEFAREKDKKEVDRHLKRMVKDGLLRFNNETGEYKIPANLAHHNPGSLVGEWLRLY